MSPYEIGAVYSGLLALTGVLFVLAVFGLYALEDHLRDDDEEGEA